MPFGNMKMWKDLSKGVLAITALILIFGTLPFVGIGLASPFLLGLNVATFLGIAIGAVAYMMHKNSI